MPRGVVVEVGPAEAVVDRGRHGEHVGVALGGAPVVVEAEGAEEVLGDVVFGPSVSFWALELLGGVVDEDLEGPVGLRLGGGERPDGSPDVREE